MWLIVLGFHGMHPWILIRRSINSDHRCILWDLDMVAQELTVQVSSSSSSYSCYSLGYLLAKWLLPCLLVCRLVSFSLWLILCLKEPQRSQFCSIPSLGWFSPLSAALQFHILPWTSFGGRGYIPWILTPVRLQQWSPQNFSINLFSHQFKLNTDPLPSGLVIRCKSDEFAVFNPPDGQTCAAWGQDFVNKFGGYIDNLNDTIACRYCQFAVGDEFFLPLNIEFSNRWRDAFILFCYFGEKLLIYQRHWPMLNVWTAIVFNLIITISE